jgi:hypothetical protein
MSIILLDFPCFPSQISLRFPLFRFFRFTSLRAISHLRAVELSNECEHFTGGFIASRSLDESNVGL